MFIHPFAMMLGTLLISAPIIIHLINRIRYKRVRWAAMEFLLKSQKRSRRKMIIEQLILLLLRILLVLLVAFLLARYLGCQSGGDTEEKETMHIIILDVTASMGDVAHDAQGKDLDTMAEAKKAILEKITREAVKAPTPQHVRVLLLSSKPEDPKSKIGRLNAATLQELEDYLKTVKVQEMHHDLLTGLEQAQKLFNETKEMKRVLHVVSDFRGLDWANSATQKKLSDQFEAFKTTNTTVYLFDAGQPERPKTDTQKPPRYSDNLAITDFRSSTRVAIKDEPTDFILKVANYGTSEKQGLFIRLRVNGKEQLASSVNIGRIQPNEEVTVRVPVTLTETESDGKGLDAEKKKLAQLKRFSVVSAHLEEGGSGLAIDNTRYTVVEVRNRIPLLLVDNNVADYRSKRSESFFIWKFFQETLKGYDVQLRPMAELEKINLQPYAFIVMVNIAAAKADQVPVPETIRKKLEEYVSDGGGLAFFMGPAIGERDVKFYNEVLYKSGKGLFPVPVEEKPKNITLGEKELNDLKAAMRFTLTKHLLVRKTMRSHAGLAGLYGDSRSAKRIEDSDEFGDLTYNIAFPNYFIVNRRAMAGAEEKSTEVLMNLPYFGSSLKGAAEESIEADSAILNEANKLIKRIPVDDVKYKEYRDQLIYHQKQIQDAVGDTKTRLPELATMIDFFLNEKGEKDSAGKVLKADLRPFWAEVDILELRREFDVLVDRMKYGDAMYVTKPYGKGRVVAWLGSAGTSWNPSDTAFFAPFLRDGLRAYLSSSNPESALHLGEAQSYSFEPLQYTPKVTKWFAKLKAPQGGAQGEMEAVPDSLGEQVMETIEASETRPKHLKFTFKDSEEPGVYFFEFVEQRANANGELDLISDFRAQAYNFSTKDESDLLRVSTDDLKKVSGVEKVHTMASEELGRALSQRKRDLSESPWLYLIMLLVLIAEQAMAVRLSFHSRSADAAIAPAPVMTGRGIVTA